jgi:hypothetical protein
MEEVMAEMGACPQVQLRGQKPLVLCNQCNLAWGISLDLGLSAEEEERGGEGLK